MIPKGSLEAVNRRTHNAMATKKKQITKKKTTTEKNKHWFRSRKSKTDKHNGQKKKDKQRSTEH
jgi:bisphosphoglycerate-dependent phosphoglycerate mutase